MKYTLFSFALLFVVFGFGQKKVWIDTDIMIGMPDDQPREVDDGIALIMALKQPHLDIVGISNISYVDYGYKMIEKILDWHHKGEPIPIYKGVDSPEEIYSETAASKALYEALKKEKLTILALGPYTNVATVLKNHPDIHGQIEEIVMCAARTPDLPFNPGDGKTNVFDYNFEWDTEAMKVILDTDIPLTFAGYEPSSYTHIGLVDLDGLDLRQEADRWLYDVVQPWMGLNERVFSVYGFIPFDCSTLGVISHPEYFDYLEEIPIKMIWKKNDAPDIQPDVKEKYFLEVSYDFTTDRKVKYATRAKHGFEEKILESLPVRAQ